MTAPDPGAPLHGAALLAAASRLSAWAHAGQVDAHGAPYGGHVQRVVARAERLRAQHAPDLDRFEIAAIAYLHDVVEDSDLDAGDLLRAGIPVGVIAAVEVLTHRRHEPRVEYLASVARVLPAVLVKMADTADNADPVRLGKVAVVDPARHARLVGKYAAQMDVLTTALEHHLAAVTADAIGHVHAPEEAHA